MVPCKRWICECLRSSGWFACVLVPCEAQRVPTDFPIPDKMAAELRHPIHNMGPSLYRCFVWRRGREWEGMCSRKTLISHLTRSLFFSLSLSFGHGLHFLKFNCVADCTLWPPCDPSLPNTLQLLYNTCFTYMILTYLVIHGWLAISNSHAAEWSHAILSSDPCGLDR